MKKYFNQKVILVTGGVGSIGSKIVQQLIKYRPAAIRIFDNNETGLFELEQELRSRKIRILTGDIRDKDRVKRAVEGVDIVFHVAALKHVPLCEYNPFEAVKINVLGTQNIIDAAMDEEVEKLITISTDKAVNPISVMGATKLLAERLTVSANLYRGKRRTVFSCVRFGNVFNSRGSVISIFKEQISKGGPLTVTSKDMTRFFMDLSRAVKLVLEAAKLAKGGEIFILKMPVVNMKNLAEVMIEELASNYDYSPHKLKIKLIGKRPGEKLHEELITDSEAENTFENKKIFILLSPTNRKVNKLLLQKQKGFKKLSKTSYSSKDIKSLSKAKIKILLKKAGFV